MDILGLIQINDWLLLIIILLTVAYKYFTWNFGYFESRGIPGPKPVPFFGTMLALFKRSLFEIDIEYGRKYGKVYGLFEGRQPSLMIHDPELLKCIFIKNSQDFPTRRNFTRGETFSDSMLMNAEGEQWRLLRTVMSPTFSTGKLKVMTKQICECAQEFVEGLSKDSDAGKPVDLKERSGLYTMDVIASTAFGLKIDSQKDKNNQFVKMAKKIFEFNIFNPVFLVGFFFPFLLPVLSKLKVSFWPKDVKKFFSDATTQAIEARKESGQTRLDFIQLMLNAHKEPNDEKQEDKEHDKEFKEVYKGVAKRGLTMEEVVAQGMLFFIAGYDTTATSVAFLLYNLTLNPEIQEKLYEEIVDAAGDKEITYNMLCEMNLLDLCVQESLRMYPPAGRTERECSADTKIGDMDIPKGMLIQVPIYAIHYDPKIWPEPEKFDPYRFTSEEKAKHTAYDWIPFGSGPRNCIAMRLALAEVKIAVVYLVRAYKFVRCEKTEVPIKLKRTGLITPENGVWLGVEKR